MHCNVDKSPCGYLLLTTQGYIKDANEAFCKMIDYDCNELLDKHIESFLPTASKIIFHSLFLLQLQFDISVDEVYLTFKTKDETTIPILLMGNKETYNGDEFINCFVIKMFKRNDSEKELRHIKMELEDAYKIKSAALEESHKKLLQLEKEKNASLEKSLKMKNEFLSIISHEFKTPINVITSAIQTMNLICRDEISEKMERYIKMIDKNTLRQLRLVNNLLDITRANSDSIKVHKKNIDIFYLTKSIVNSVNTYASGKDVSVTFISSFSKKIIGLDDDKYERILLNLISNAIKFSYESKLITVKMRTVKNNIRIEVIDKGIGIPEDKIHYIFGRFGQVDSSLSRYAEGAGIGLSLVKEFAEALGGSISVKSKLGKGSTFTLMLPNEKLIEDNNKTTELLDNHLFNSINLEFSDIYL
ncbi:PAS domain-containing sensor histidine kinase [Clostridium chromiireducens]|nr:PAS domain-containing sensor histidine kinase [Clostridium chromiireducens]